MDAYHILRCVWRNTDDATFAKIVAECESLEGDSEFRRLIRRIKAGKMPWDDERPAGSD
jgi:hypothetical protein